MATIVIETQSVTGVALWSFGRRVGGCLWLPFLLCFLQGAKVYVQTQARNRNRRNRNRRLTSSR